MKVNRSRAFRRFNHIIVWSFILLLLGRAYQHFFWSTPYYEFFWDEYLIGSLVESLGYSWGEMVGSDNYLSFIELFNITTGIVFLITIFLILKEHRYTKLFLFITFFLLVFFILCNWIGYNFEILILFEYAAQLSLPVYFILTYKKGIKDNHLVLLKVGLALTFIAHGSYALDFMPVPGDFLDMIISIFNTSESTATKILVIAGILDYITAILIFIPPLKNVGLAYMIIWGFLTAAARIVAHIETDFLFLSLHSRGFEFLVRAPHFMIPLAMMYIYNKTKK